MFLKDVSIRFGEFVLDSDNFLRTSNGMPVPLTPKALDLLCVLIENCGHVVDKEKLIERVWKDSFVEEGNLPYTIRLLRKALGDDADRPRFIQTVSRRGYRFIPECKTEPEQPELKRLAFPYEGRVVEDKALIARDKEVFEITRLLASMDVSMLTLTGAGGTGKTRIAREIARRASADFRDGVFFVELAAVTEPEMLLSTIAHELGIIEKGSLIEKVADFFRNRAALLVLDNFEQIASAGVDAAALQKAAGTQLKILVTSREPLKVTIETEYRVQPLALPSVGRIGEASLPEVMESGSAQLFVKRAQAARDGLELTDEDAADLSGICHLLDGLPLAIELAASRAKVLSLREIVSKLENRLKLLTGGPKDLPRRQQTMRAAIEWSYGLLSKSERRVFGDLAVFENGFTFEAAEKIVDDAELLDVITSLTEKCLLVRETASSGRLRFRMLVVVRDFAAELFEKSGRAEAIRRRHTDYFLELAERAAPEMRSGRSGEWNERLDADHDNFRAALQWSIDDDPMKTARLAAALEMFWTVHGHFRECHHWIGEIFAREVELPRELRWVLLSRLGIMHQFWGDFEKACEHYQTCLEESQHARHSKQVAFSLRGLAAVAYMQGCYDDSRDLSLRALDIASSIGDGFGVAAGHSRLSDIALSRLDLPEARTRAIEALRIFREQDYKYGMAAKLYALGIADYFAGDYEAARSNFANGFSRSIDIGDKQIIHLAFDGCAALLLNDGDLRNAARLAGFAKAMAEKIDYRLEPAENMFRESYVSRLREESDASEFDADFAEGRRMSFSLAAELILDWTGHSHPKSLSDRDPNTSKRDLEP